MYIHNSYRQSEAGFEPILKHFYNPPVDYMGVGYHTPHNERVKSVAL